MIELYILGGIGAVVLGIVAGNAGKVIWRRILRPKAKGYKGESKVRGILKKFSRKGARTKNDLLIPSQRGTTQIDHVMVSRHGIFVIETKNYSGIIDGAENGSMWRQMFPDSFNAPRHFFNPILQNKGHIQALRNILDGYENIPIHSIVAFSPTCTFPRYPGVFSTTELKNAIKFMSSGPPVLTDKEIADVVQQIEKHEITGLSDRATHNFKASLSSTDKEEVDALIQHSVKHAVHLDFSSAAPQVQRTSEFDLRHRLTDIYAEMRIRNRTDTIEGFFEKSKMREDGSEVPTGGSYDYFICPFTGDRFPPEESSHFYQGLWITYLNQNPDLVSYMKENGVENLGNSYRCKKALSLYNGDKDAFIQSVRSSQWYQNMAQKKRRSLNSVIDSASARAVNHGQSSPVNHREEIR